VRRGAKSIGRGGKVPCRDRTWLRPAWRSAARAPRAGLGAVGDLAARMRISA
jgi:hypothetical protein